MTSYLEVPPVILSPPEPPRMGGESRAHHGSSAQRTNHPEGASASAWLTEHNISSVVPPRKPSQIAWDAYRDCSPINKQKYGKILPDFCTYMDMCDNSGFSASGISMSARCTKYPAYQLEQGTGKNDYGKRQVSGPLLNRWHPKRRMQWLARMYQLALWYEANRIEGCTLISLTGYQENSGLSIYDTWDNINESRGKILKILRKVFPKLDYFWVVEPHTENNTGYPHYHLAVFREVDNNIKDSYGEGMENKLRRLYSKEWQTGSHTYGLDFKVMKGDRSIKDLKNYLMKYISKGYVNDAGWSEAELIFNAHLYGATHGFRDPKAGEMLDYRGQYSKKYRLIGMSKNLSNLLHPEKEDKEQIVWLHTDEVEPQEIKIDDGTITTEERIKVLYDRMLIPDFVEMDIVGSYIKGKERKQPFYGYLHHDPDKRFKTKRNMILTDVLWWRDLAKIQSWSSCVFDEKAARRARHKDTSW
jgi:hypothetical protein